MKLVQLKMREARFWPKMKFEPIFFQVLWQFFNPKVSLLRAGGRGVLGEFRPPYKFWAKSVRIFSNAHRQLGNVFVGSPSARARQPILGANWNFLSLPRYCGAGQKRASRIFIFNF
ncbi:hypothetical protein KKF49_02485 [Patescibacteria group bacterium]|nr:hypothetical protein [Patescibacteria group bacterium]MBU1844809.1 hypothetical protein [Patescibacteria group bacterium]